ncbi:rhomboid family intramembrane serine protease [Natronobiforma cellulositropha]|uniref:rhomboid family intramembrane serine protease n=1 Tax=Natronobiforma cellulositropha TaxID=1679076 RepID=UPI0021D5DC2E|nr:protease [Natronobiforma cellulositropha]
MLSSSAVLAGLVVVTLVLSVGAIRYLTLGHSRRWPDIASDRLVMGVPWGTLVVIGFVLSFYLLVQDGLTDWSRPVTIPFRAWSYFYPLGILTGSFAHDSAGHLTGNLIGTAMAAPIAEYAWGHYPRERDRHAPSRFYHRPWVRALVVFPAAVVCIGLLTSVFALGPVIGFSSVVYAFAGFAIVRYPITTLVATTTAQGALSTIYRALGEPILTQTAQARPPSAPSWATIAIQGHALGFFIGFVCAIAIFHRRGLRQDPLRLWVAIVLFAFAKSLWAIYWFGGGDEYILFQGPGVAIVVALALVLTLAVVSSNRPLVPRSIRRRLLHRNVPASTRRSLELGLPFEGERRRTHERIYDMVVGSASGSVATGAKRWDGSRSRSSVTTSLATTSRRGVVLLAVTVVLALLVGPSIPVNMFVLDGESSPGEEAITVGDYSVTYAEGVENELISVVDIEAFGQDTTVETGGVIVWSEERNIWMDAISEQRLAHSGSSQIQLGGLGWREPVTAVRQGWSATGGDTAYQVWLRAGDDPYQHVFTSEPAQADVVLAGQNVTVVPHEGAFFLVVADGESEPAAALIPNQDARFSAGEVTFERDGRTVYAEVDDTRVQVARQERYSR